MLDFDWKSELNDPSLLTTSTVALLKLDTEDGLFGCVLVIRGRTYGCLSLY